MSLSVVVFLAGLFGVPLVLLGLGHRIRRRAPQARATFWGAVLGHCVAGVIAVTFGLIPPEAWTPDDRVRGLATLWSLLVLPLLGALGGAVLHRQRTA